jgi:hypothetical protein
MSRDNKELNMAEDNRKDETVPANLGDVASASVSEPTVDVKPDSGDDTKARRLFLTSVGAVAVGAAAVGSMSLTRPRSSKSRILARIEEELDKEYVNDPLTYTSTGYDMYVKGS